MWLRSLAVVAGLLVPFAASQACDAGAIVTTYSTCVQGAINAGGYDGVRLCNCISDYIASVISCGVPISQADCRQFLQPYFSSAVGCINACDRIGGGGGSGSNSSGGGGFLPGGYTGVPNCTAGGGTGSCVVAGGIWNLNVNYQYTGWTQFTQSGTLHTVGTTLAFAAGSNTTFQSQTTFSGSGAVSYGSGSAVAFAESAAVAYRSTTSFVGSAVTVAAAATVRFAARVSVSGGSWSGAGTVIYEAAVSYTMSFSGSIFAPSLYVFGGSRTTSTSRAIDLSGFTTVTFCGATQGPVIVNGTSAVVLQLSCTAAGGQASNVLQSLQFLTSTGVLVLQGPAAGSLPSVVNGWTNTSNVPLRVDFTPSGQASFSTVMLAYAGQAQDGQTVSCPTTVAGSISGCDSGATCAISGGAFNATYCAISFSYKPGSSGSNMAALGWLGLLAVLPVVGIPAGYLLYQHYQSRQAEFMEAPPYPPAAWGPYPPAYELPPNMPMPTPVNAPYYSPY